MISAWYEWLFDILQDFIPRTKQENASTMGTAPNVPPYQKGQDSPVKTIRTTKCGSCEETGTSSNRVGNCLTKASKCYETKLFYEERFSDIQKFVKCLSKGSHLPSEMYLCSEVASTDEAKSELFNRHFQSAV